MEIKPRIEEQNNHILNKLAVQRYLIGILFINNRFLGKMIR